jgi:hypothetical protein
MSFWNANLDGSLHIVWSTGYVGHDIQLNGSGAEFRGTAHYFTNTEPFPRTNRNTAVVSNGLGVGSRRNNVFLAIDETRRGCCPLIQLQLRAFGTGFSILVALHSRDARLEGLHL